MENNKAEKKNTRISKQQKEKLVDYMSTNLEFARRQFDGLNSNVNSKEQWEMLTNSLNSLGGSAKTVEQWKKCWTDLKAGVRKQVNARRAFINRTGGGSRADIPRDLNAFEEQVLGIITTDAVDGDSRTAESGVVNLQSEETMLSIEILEENFTTTSAKILEDEAFPTPAKKAKTSANNSKYSDSLQEAREMTNKVLEKLEGIEKQNALLLKKFEEHENNKVLEKLDNIERQNALILKKLGSTGKEL